MDTLRIMCDGPKPGQASGVGGPETIASADGSGLASVDRGLPMLTSGRFHWVLERPCEPRSELRECEGGCVPASKTRSIAMTLQKIETPSCRAPSPRSCSVWTPSFEGGNGQTATRREGTSDLIRSVP